MSNLLLILWISLENSQSKYFSCHSWSTSILSVSLAAKAGSFNLWKVIGGDISLRGGCRFSRMLLTEPWMLAWLSESFLSRATWTEHNIRAPGHLHISNAEIQSKLLGCLCTSRTTVTPRGHHDQLLPDLCRRSTSWRPAKWTWPVPHDPYFTTMQCLSHGGSHAEHHTVVWEFLDSISKVDTEGTLRGRPDWKEQNRTPLDEHHFLWWTLVKDRQKQEVGRKRMSSKTT